MKPLVLIVGLLLQFMVAYGQNGVAFDTSFVSWDAVLRKAKQLNKPIFVDLYTTWCSPCRHMDRSIFPQREVGKYYNENYLCIKINAEKGYGVTFTKKNKIDAYPSFLFFTPTGEVLRIDVGFKKAPTFVALGQAVMKEYKSGDTLQAMEDKIKSGKYDAAFLMAYIKMLGRVQRSDIKSFEKYLSSLSVDSLYSNATTRFVDVYYNGWVASNSLGFAVLLHAYKRYPIRDFELMKPWCMVDKRLQNNIDLAITKKDSLRMEDIIKEYHKIDTEPDNFRMDKEYAYCYYFAGIGDSLKFTKYLRQYIKDNIIDEEEGKQQQQELKKYRTALKFKFGIDNEKLLAPKDKWFSKSYFNNYDLILMKLKGLQLEYTDHIKKSPECEKIFSKALQAALSNYEKYSPNYNESIIPFYAENK